jgi:hypothetical protein
VLNEFRANDRPLLTSVSKLHIGNGLVRISAGMVGILLNSCSGENDDARLDDEILTEPWPGRVRIIGGEQSAEPGARS